MVLALAWALYLIPKAVRHTDEDGRGSSVERFSSAMRVLARNDPAEEAAVRDGAAPVPSVERAPAHGAQSGQVAQRSLAARRAAARAAARRRRRVTSVLLVADLGAAVLAVLTVTPWWAAAVPAALTVLYLVLCRRQVRRENDALWAPRARSEAGTPAPRQSAHVDTAYAEQARVDREGHDRGASDDGDVRIPVTDGEAVPVVMETADGGSLWDPLPVTLPTYVTKARASRTVRTIDLGAPGAWSSGHDDADQALVDESTASDNHGEEPVQEHRRAVGS